MDVGIVGQHLRKSWRTFDVEHAVNAWPAQVHIEQKDSGPAGGHGEIDGRRRLPFARYGACDHERAGLLLNGSELKIGAQNSIGL